jgi:AcrR family transcriptional regulator
MVVSPHPNPKDEMIAAAVTLVRSRGASATGFSDIIELSGAPRGSIYHHFPKGKSELLVAMIERAAGVMAGLIRAEAEQATSAADLVHRIARVFAAEPIQSGWTQGCPIAAATVEGDHQPESVREAAGRTFGLWIDTTASALQRVGVPNDASAALASAIVAGIEGGLIVARGQRGADNYTSIVSILADRAERASAGAK